MDSRGRCGEWCIVTLLSVRVDGVGDGVTCCVAGHRFAWRAQGIVRGSCARNRVHVPEWMSGVL